MRIARPRHRFCVALLVTLAFSTGAAAQARFRRPRRISVEREEPPKAPSQQTASKTPERSDDQSSGDKPGATPDQPIHLPIPDSLTVAELDFNNQPIRDVLRLLSAPYGINIAVEPGLDKRVTLRLTDVRLKDAIRFVVEENGYAFALRNNIIKVHEPEPPPPPPPPKPPEPVQTFTAENGKLTVDLKDAPLDSVIRWIADHTGRNIILERGISGKVTAFFKELPIDKGLITLFETNGFETVDKDGLTYLFPGGGGVDGAEDNKRGRIRRFVDVSDGLVTFDVSDAPVNTIIKEVARQAQIDIYLYGEIDGAVTAKVTGMPIDELFESLLRGTNSTFWVSKGIYFFGGKELYDKRVTELIELNYLRADDIIPLLPKSVTGNATIKTVKEYNALLVEAPTSDLVDVTRAFVEKIDKPIAQILIEAWVVEVKLDKLRKFGLKLFEQDDGYTPPNDHYYPNISVAREKEGILDFLEDYINVSSNVRRILPHDFAMQMDLLESEGVSNLISRPQIATLNGHAANITFGTTQYFLLQKEISPSTTDGPIRIEQRYEKVNVDMTLSVTPWVSSNNEVTMDIRPSFDVPGTSPSANIPPPIDRRSLSSKVRVRDGEMIILGGLIGESKSQSIEKVPLLGDLPLLGYLFSSRKTERSKSQLMIYLIPHIYYGSERSIDPETVSLNSFDPPSLVVEREPDKREERRLRRQVRRKKFRKWWRSLWTRLRERREQRKQARAKNRERPDNAQPPEDTTSEPDPNDPQTSDAGDLPREPAPVTAEE